MLWSSALPTFFVTLREGFEAALVVGIVLAAIQRSQQNHLQPWAYGGVLVGLVGSLGAGFGLQAILQALQNAYPSAVPVLQPALKAGIGLIAIALLSWMLLWMTQQSRSLKTDLEAVMQDHLQQNTTAHWGILGLVSTAVVREGLETVLFIEAQAQTGLSAVLGAIAGLLTATFLGVLLFQWGVRLNLRRFFQVMGIVLLLIVGGLLLGVFKSLDAAALAWNASHPTFGGCWSAQTEPVPSCLLGSLLWDASQVLPDRQFPGIFLKTLFGYRDRLYLVQAIAYVAFWLTIGRAYLKTLVPAAVSAQPPSAAESSHPVSS